jgi:hypothetical protein
LDIRALARQLYEARHLAQTVPYMACSLPGWSPAEKECHRNADYWCLHNPGHLALSGWMVFDWTAAFLLDQPSRYHFTAHSVVRAPNGALFDLTPSQAHQRYPFLPHPGPDEEFVALVEGHQITQLDHFL